MMTKSLIEQWFPISAVGAESLRERGSPKAYPPLNFLHAWWARRPLSVSRAAVLATLLECEPSEDVMRWFLHVVGIHGDPVTARRQIENARRTGVRTRGNAYGYERAFTYAPTSTDVQPLLAQYPDTPPVVYDPFAGGGSIPFEARRLGCDVLASDLNPVAVAILRSTAEDSWLQPDAVLSALESFSDRWKAAVAERLAPLFSRDLPDEEVAYVWAHAVPCPSTKRPTPLLPNSWLANTPARRVAFEVSTQGGELSAAVVDGARASEVGPFSTYKGGNGTSVWDPSATFDSSYVREAGQRGEISFVPLAVAISSPRHRARRFRSFGDADQAPLGEVANYLETNWPRWELHDLVPSESFPAGADNRPIEHGMKTWADFFTPRQLASNITILEEGIACLPEVLSGFGTEIHRAVALHFAFTMDRIVNYNSRLSGWDSGDVGVSNVFDRHDFSFKSTFGEFDASSSIMEWSTENSIRNAKRMFDLVGAGQDGQARTFQASAVDSGLPDESVDAVVTDPPYYDNVMYSELSDFFYVWMKRSLREVHPDLCVSVLTDKAAEAVANSSQFVDLVDAHSELSPSMLADRRYEELLRASFSECRRVLKPGGRMTVMFTHKRVDAWDTLGAALIDAGFQIVSAWPVHTEAENSLHTARKNSATSTVLLTCRVRQSDEPSYWSDVRSDVERTAETAAAHFSADGIKGVDLTLATYGPALSVLSRNWPVYTGNLDDDGKPEVIRPDVALDLARERVAQLKKRELLGGRTVEFDRATDWWLLAWNDFQAAQFPAGEALKLCIAMDLDLEDVAKGYKLVKAASGNVTIQTPAQRRTARALDVDAGGWPTLIDALHALMLVQDQDGLQAAERWLLRTGYKDDERFSALVEAAIHAVPRAREKDGSFSRPEARVLESLRSTLFSQIEAPDEEAAHEQSTLFEL